MCIVDGAVQTHQRVLQEIVSGEEGVLRAGVGQDALGQGHPISKHLCGAVPVLVHIAEVVHGTVESAHQHQGQFLAFGLWQIGGNDKVAVGCCRADIGHALVVKTRSQDVHIRPATERVVPLFDLFQHGGSMLTVQGTQIGDDFGDTAVQIGLVLSQEVHIGHHVGIDLTHVLAQRGIGVEQQIQVKHEVVVALPQRAQRAKESHTLFHFDLVDGAGGRCGHDQRRRRCAAQHTASPQDDVPVGEQVEVVDAVAVQKQIERLTVEAVFGIAFESCDFFVAVPAHDAQHVLVVLEVEK